MDWNETRGSGASGNRSWSPGGSSGGGGASAELGDLDVNTDVYSKATVTGIYAALFVVGFVGNSVTLYGLWSRRSLQKLQSTVHYHLASLAVSDLLILLLSMPIELHSFIWFHHPWVFGDSVCRGYYFLRDSCSYATALNIASLSVERYMAMCHPFKAKSIMSRSRTMKVLGALWLASFALSTPMVFIMGQQSHQGENICTVVVSAAAMKAVLQVNAFLSFVLPMLLISLLNTAIANQLLHTFGDTQLHSHVCVSRQAPPTLSVTVETHRAHSLRHGVLVLRAVVVAFVVCWLPYHARRLMFCYVSDWSDALTDFYHYFYMLTNVLFYVSSAINPVLYNLVSASQRHSFLSRLRTAAACCCCCCCRRRCAPWTTAGRTPPRPLSRQSISISHTSSNIIRETVY